MMKIVAYLTTALTATVIGRYIVLGGLKISGHDTRTISITSQWIGYLERLLVVTFVFMGLTGQTVFIFATKAAVIAYRIPKNSSAESQRIQAEYMLIGSMLSYLVGLLFGLIGKNIHAFL